jgi:NAD(P)H-hydrate epimerase
MGELVIAPIGIPERLLASAALNVTTPNDLKLVGGRRERDTHKGTYGHVAILGGARGKHGALQLAGEAAISAGAGWVTLSSPDQSFEPALSDLMRRPWPQTNADLEGYRVVAAGPGLGMDAEAKLMVEALYRSHQAAVVLDADALNLLAPLDAPHESDFPRVLTPHPGEMKRLLGRPVHDRCEDARWLAQKTKCTVVLKGYRTVIAFADGQIWINPTGSPALAKAGSGDVLTGMIAALLSQYPTQPQLAVLAAVYLHGRCGELAHEKTSLASRLCDHLAEAFDELA